MAHTEDLWLAPDGSKRPRHGTGRRWRVRWVDPDGSERSRSFDRKTDARAFETGIEADLQRGVYRDPKAGQTTLRKVAEEWLASRTFSQQSRDATERRIRLHILPVLGSRPVARITKATVQSWLGGLDVAPSTARLLLGLLSAILARAVDDELIGVNPAAAVKGPKGEKRLLVPWTCEQVAVIRGALPGRYQAMVDCGAGLGLRIGEVLGLAAEDVDWLRHTVHVRRQLMRVSGRVVFGLPKGSKERKVPLPDSVALVLSEHIRRCPPVPVSLPWQVPGGKLVAAGLLFSSVQGKAVEQVSWRTSAWYPAIRAAGFEPARDTGFHQLRHHYASRLLAAGIDVRTLASALGHADPAVTLRVYSHLMPDAADRIRAAIDSGASGQASGDTHTATAAGTAISHGTVTALERKTLV